MTAWLILPFVSLRWGGWTQPTDRPISLAQGRFIRLTKLDSTNVILTQFIGILFQDPCLV
jgi:hypothetical protein